MNNDGVNRGPCNLWSIEMMTALSHTQDCEEETCECYELKKRSEQLREDTLILGAYLLNRAKFEKIVDDGMGTNKEGK